MISFYPGPSRVHDEIPAWTKDAMKEGVLSMSHRSPEFIRLSARTIKLIKKKLAVPDSFTVYFTSSATECWEIIAQSLIINKSIHLYNGAFGSKWFDYTMRLKPEAKAIAFNPESELKSEDQVFTEGDIICITQNETSNGTQVSNGIIKKIRDNNPDHLIAVDATSSMGGISLTFASADVWFASVQKCFGLPAGLAVMICSPRAVQRIVNIGEHAHYNSLSFLHEMMLKWQTPCTPNVLGIYLLKKSLKQAKKIMAIHEKVSDRQKRWIKFFQHAKDLQLFIKNSSVQSKTVITVKGNAGLISKVKAAARKEGLLLGEGYGDFKNETFRIANFPAIMEREIISLMKFLRQYR